MMKLRSPGEAAGVVSARPEALRVGLSRNAQRGQLLAGGEARQGQSQHELGPSARSAMSAAEARVALTDCPDRYWWGWVILGSDGAVPASRRAGQVGLGGLWCLS